MTSPKLPMEVKPNKTDIMTESRHPIIETVFASLSKQPPGKKKPQKELELFAASECQTIEKMHISVIKE